VLRTTLLKALLKYNVTNTFTMWPDEKFWRGLFKCIMKTVNLAQNGMELFWTFFYHDLLYRNTINPLKEVIEQPNNDIAAARLAKWATRKADESKYIQLAVWSYLSVLVGLSDHSRAALSSQPWPHA
jgi:hypothetical protein